ncbi:MAG: hypothetical protein GY780_05205 [bacterium]|nr:hypothetical protein [bacterium]
MVQFKAADLLENDPEFLKRSSENNNLSRFLDLFRSVEKEQNTTNGMKSKSLDSAVLEMKKIATEMPDNEFQFIGKIRNQAYVRNGPRLPQEAMIKDLLQSLDTPEMKLEALHDASQTVELEINYFLHVQDQLNPGVDAIWNRDHCPEIQAVRKSLQKEFSFLTKYKNKNRNDFDFKKTLSMTESFHLQGFDLNMRIIADLLKKNCP